jgi:hypothetical protein
MTGVGVNVGADIAVGKSVAVGNWVKIAVATIVGGPTVGSGNEVTFGFVHPTITNHIVSKSIC